MKQTVFLSLFLFMKLVLIGQVEKRGFIDYEKVLHASSFYDTSQIRIEAHTQLLRDSLETIQLEFHNLIYETPHNAPELDSARRRLLENNLKVVQIRIQNFSQYAETEINNLIEKERNDLRLRINKIATEFCNANNIICLADKKAVLYCEGCTDFTEELIFFMRHSE
jgi:Skp family chaperone for outer membrane proteins